MAGVRFVELQARPMEFRDFTSVTLDEFQQLVPSFEAAFRARMAMWRMDGKPRTVRRFTVYKNCPLPTPEDRLFFILTSSKLTRFRWSRGAYSGWSRAKRIDGFTFSCPPCWRPSAPSVMPPPAPCQRWRSGLVSQRSTRLWWSPRWRKRLHLWPQRQPPGRRPPFCP